jgi:hypothetical protein
VTREEMTRISNKACPGYSVQGQGVTIILKRRILRHYKVKMYSPYSAKNGWEMAIYHRK